MIIIGKIARSRWVSRWFFVTTSEEFEKPSVQKIREKTENKQTGEKLKNFRYEKIRENTENKQNVEKLEKLLPEKKSGKRQKINKM